MFPELFQDSTHNFIIKLAGILSIDQDIIKIHYDQNIKLFCKNLVDIALIIGRYIKKFKKYDLILRVAITSLKASLLFVTFLNSYLIIDASQV